MIIERDLKSKMSMNAKELQKGLLTMTETIFVFWGGTAAVGLNEHRLNPEARVLMTSHDCGKFTRMMIGLSGYWDKRCGVATRTFGNLSENLLKNTEGVYDLNRSSDGDLVLLRLSEEYAEFFSYLNDHDEREFTAKTRQDAECLGIYDRKKLKAMVRMMSIDGECRTWLYDSQHPV